MPFEDDDAQSFGDAGNFCGVVEKKQETTSDHFSVVVTDVQFPQIQKGLVPQIDFALFSPQTPNPKPKPFPG